MSSFSQFLSRLPPFSPADNKEVKAEKEEHPDSQLSLSIQRENITREREAEKTGWESGLKSVCAAGDWNWTV